MDTSKQFVKMCSSAREIQALWQFKMGDWFSYELGIEVLDEDFKDEKNYDRHGMTRDERIASFMEDEFNPVFLPRQDQLQAMYLRFRNFDSNGREYADQIGLVQMLDNLHEWYFYEGGDSYPALQSFEQLWLAFVVKELYSKRWNSETWVTI